MMRYGQRCQSCTGIRVLGEGRGGMCVRCTDNLTGRMVGAYTVTARPVSAPVPGVRVTVNGVTETVPQDGYVTDRAAVREVVARHLDTFGCVVSVEDVPLHWRDGGWRGGSGHYRVVMRVR